MKKILKSNHPILNCYYCHHINQNTLKCDIFYPQSIDKPREKICKEFCLRESGDITRIKEFILGEKPLIKKFLTQIRKKGKKIWKQADEVRERLLYGREEGLSMAFNIMKSLIQFEYSQYNDIVDKVEKEITY